MSAVFGTSAFNGKKDPEVSRNIYLPSEDYVIQTWKVTAGSPVRVGDKIAVAVRRVQDDPNVTNNTSSTGPNSTTQSATTASAAAAAVPHRRPKKRRRPGAVNEESLEGEQDDNTNTVHAAAQQHDSLLQTSELTETANTRSSLLPPQHSVTLIAPADGLLRITSEQPLGALNEKLSGMVGYIEECLHPQIIMGMCAVCGTAIAANPQSESNNNINNDGTRKEPSTSTTTSNGDTRSNVTVSGGITMIVSEREGQHIAQQTAERLNKQQKLSLVLDLDHTLVHATYDARARTHLNRDDVRTVVLPVFENIAHASQRQAWTWHYIKLRPHVKEFLESVLPMYEVGVYTAGTRLYAEQITMILSRHVVGAKMDQPELDGLRHRVAQMEHELQQQQNAAEDAAKQPAKEDTKKAAKSGKQAIGVAVADALAPDAESSATVEDSSKEAFSSSAPDASENGQEPNHNNEQPSRTRKRVTFDPAENVAQAAANHDQPEQQQVNNEGNQANGIARAGDQGDDDDEDVSHRKRVRFGEPGQNSWYNNSENDPVDEDSDAARGGCKPRKRVSFGEPPESNRIDPAELEELRQQLAEAERLELAASKLRQQLFGSRIVSRTDVGDLGKDVKSLRRIFPCGGTMAVVVDDREDVWANALDNASGRKGEPPENLLLVRPYHWKPFLGFADVNNAAGADLSSTSSSSSPSSAGDGTAAAAESNSAANAPETDVQLLWTRDILERLHRKYFAENSKNRDPPKSVASILHDMRAKVLKNTRLVLSALVPLRKQTRTPSLTAPRPPVVRIAESLGAKLLDTVEPSVTHVVAAKDGTEKTIRARRLPTCQVVKASWLMECLWSLTRRDEQPHWFTSSSGAVSPLRQPPPLMMRSMPTPANYNNYTKNPLVLPLDPRTESTTSSSSSSSSNSDNDEDDEDFAATLENELMDSNRAE